MKKIYFILLFTVLIGLCSCEHYDVADNTFTFKVVYKQSSFLVYDVYPLTNGFEYTTFIASLDALERLGTIGLIDSIYYKLDKRKTYTRGVRIINDNLDPGTEYFMCCFRLDSKHEPVYKLVKKAFTTPEEEDLTIDIEWSAREDTLIAEPTTSQSYFWTYTPLAYVNSYYDGNISFGYYSEIAYYETYNLLQYLVSIGTSQAVITDDFPQLEEGDTLVVAASPYNLRTGYCPEPKTWYAIYTEGTFVFIEKPDAQGAPGRMKVEQETLFGKDLILPRTKRKGISCR